MVDLSERIAMFSLTSLKLKHLDLFFSYDSLGYGFNRVYLLTIQSPSCEMYFG